MREWLRDAVPFSTLTVETERTSTDGTVKTLFQTHDGHPVEAVLMRYKDGRRSLCLSSQSGCPLTCSFCATGQMAFGRNLTASEIVDQALHFRRLTEVDHAVFMGMGEPMLNLDEVLAAARRLPAIGITHRRTTISTVGWLPGLTRFVDEVDEPIRLALSLHAPTDRLRSGIMAVNDRFPLVDVIAECRRHAERTNRRVFVEYVMLADVNDSVTHAAALGELLGPHDFKVNLIPYNPTGMYDGSSRERIAAFRSEIERWRVPVTVRLTRGRDIEAACGQLAAAPKERLRSTRTATQPI
jgi:23S rRNA (adenine2503-C2)-methyltransferase